MNLVMLLVMAVLEEFLRLTARLAVVHEGASAVAAHYDYAVILSEHCLSGSSGDGVCWVGCKSAP